MPSTAETKSARPSPAETRSADTRSADTGVVTQITTVKLPPDKQDEVLALMTARAQFMAGQPGFVSICLYRSEDGSHVVNYVQWTDREKLKAAHHSPEFRKEWSHFGDLARDIEPCLYDVVHIETASMARAS